MTVRRPRVVIPIDRALIDRNLLGAALGEPSSWSTWISVLRAAFGLPTNKEDRAIFAKVAGDREPPTKRVAELWAVVGRRSGKTRMAAAVSVYIAAIEQHHLAPGEVGYVLLLAASRSQASVAFSYVVGMLEASPLLRQQIESVTSEEVRLKGNVVIGVHAGSYRTVRGRTLLAVVGDETSFWRDESSAQPDVEIFRACAPALAASGGMWIGISTGYRKLGLLYAKWRDHFGQGSDDVLVVQGDSATSHSVRPDRRRISATHVEHKPTQTPITAKLGLAAKPLRPTPVSRRLGPVVRVVSAALMFVSGGGRLTYLVFAKRRYAGQRELEKGASHGRSRWRSGRTWRLWPLRNTNGTSEGASLSASSKVWSPL